MSTPLLRLFSTDANNRANPDLIARLREATGTEKVFNPLTTFGAQGGGKSTLLTALGCGLSSDNPVAASIPLPELFVRGDTMEHTTTTCDVWTEEVATGDKRVINGLIDNKGDLKDDAEEDLKKLVQILAALGPTARAVYVVNDSINRPIKDALEAMAALYAKLFSEDDGAATMKLNLRIFLRTNRKGDVPAEIRTRLSSLFNDFDIIICPNVAEEPLRSAEYLAAVDKVREWWNAPDPATLPSCAAFAEMLEQLVDKDTGEIQPVPTLVDALTLPELKTKLQQRKAALGVQVPQASDLEDKVTKLNTAVSEVAATASFKRLSAGGRNQWKSFSDDLVSNAKQQWETALLEAQQQYQSTMETTLQREVKTCNGGAFQIDSQATTAKTIVEQKVAGLLQDPLLGGRLTEAQKASFRTKSTTLINTAFAAWKAKVDAYKAEQKRIYDASVISTKTEQRIRTDSEKSDPIFRDEQRSREVWIGGMVPKWGKMGKKTEHYTERVHAGNTVTKVMVKEERTLTTYGSGSVNTGDWRELERWTEVDGKRQ